MSVDRDVRTACIHPGDPDNARCHSQTSWVYTLVLYVFVFMPVLPVVCWVLGLRMRLVALSFYLVIEDDQRKTGATTSTKLKSTKNPHALQRDLCNWANIEII